jgi:L-alanine-DL-glutamate epimerase-like enolase superfamily enzyme
MRDGAPRAPATLDPAAKITAVRIREVTGVLPTDGVFWEERLVRPIDIYPEFRSAGVPDWGGVQVDRHRLELRQWFVQIEASDGSHGIGGPLPLEPARIVRSHIAPLLIGKDPMATELIWDQMHRNQPHGRQGESMLAVSGVDCARWDLKARVLGVPLWRLLGGKTRDRMPAYASMLGYDVTDMGRVRDRALDYQARGYRAQKWFLRHGPESGPQGMRQNVDLVRTLRETLGPDDDIMIDAWQSLTFDYAVDFCHRIEEFRPRWLEEPFMADRIDSLVKLKAKTRIPISGGEHDYTRWGFKRYFDREALDVVQPDIYWCGGLSETLKITAMATACDLIVIPHGHSTPVGIHFSVAQSPVHTPYIEYLDKWNDIYMHFLAAPVRPQDGFVDPPTAAGIGMDLDPDRITSETEW